MITKTRTKISDLPDYLYQKVLLDFDTLRKEVIKRNFKDSRNYLKNRERHWPSDPKRIYKNKGWKSWCDFLGKEEIYKQWPDLFKLKKLVKGKFENGDDYRKNRNKNWPSNPDKTYDNKGWKGWDDFLGNEWPRFETLKKQIKGKFKNQTEYRKNRNKNWPSRPHIVYLDKGWKSWCDFLGKEERYKDWPDFFELKKLVKGRFKNNEDYKKNRNKNWPSNPNKTYENKGWKGWDDFLGKN